jgi:phage tail sheath protein FI
MALTAPSMSPAIVVREIDLTGVAPNVETSLAGFCGAFKWGPVDVPTRVQNEDVLATKFGTPDTAQAVDYFSCAQFLRYSGNLIVNRTIPTGVLPEGVDSALNANVEGLSGTLIKNEDHFESQTLTDSFYAKYPGELGNSLAVEIFCIESGESAASSTTASYWESWTYADQFEDIPGTSQWALDAPGTNTNDEVHIAVIDSDGLISGTKGTVLETFPFVSVALGAKTADGGDNYIKNVLNNGSNYIWFASVDSSLNMLGDNQHQTNWGTAPSAGTTTDYASSVSWSEANANHALSGGQDHGTLDEGDYAIGFDKFEDVDEVDVQILIAPGLNGKTGQVTVVNDLVGIAQSTRKDCVVCASPNRTAVVNNIDPVNDTLETTNDFSASSYLIVDNNYLRIYDKYNDEYIYIPAASTTAGLLAATDANFGPWYSPAGERRGEYTGVTNLAYSPNKSERDELYKKGVNPIVQFPARGILLFGDKTKLARPSAFDRINVRRLFLALEKSVSIAARNFLFEFNDEFTRSEFVAIVEPLLREVQARRGIQDFFVQCDERNNTPEVIDRNELVASIFIKPARSINFITLNFVATRTGVDFEEIVGRVTF